MNSQCPCCGSYHVKQRNYAQKTLSAIGTVAGAGAGIRAVLYGGNVGIRLGVIAGPPGIAVGTLVGVIFGAMVSGDFGCKLGAAVGKEIDQNILDNHECQACGNTFSKALVPAEILSYKSPLQ